MIDQLLKSSAQLHPERSIIIDEYGSISYNELYEQTQRLKQQLLEAGVIQGMGLGIMGRNGRTFIASMLAGMACGAVVIPISHQLKQAEIETILIDTQLHAVLDDQSGVKPIDGSAIEITFSSQSLRLLWTDVSTLHPVTPLKNASFYSLYLRYNRVPVKASC